MKAKATPYIGPCLTLTTAEASIVARLLAQAEPCEAVDVLRAKCSAALSSDPSWRTPLRNVKL